MKIDYIEPVTINMVEVSEDFDMDEFDNENQIKVVYLKSGERLLEFLHVCKTKDSDVMLCPQCNVVFYKKAAKKVENTQQAKKNKN